MNPALVLIDLQQDYLTQDKLRPGAWWIIHQTSRLLEGCRRARLPIIHGRTTIPTGQDKRMTHWKLMDRRWCLQDTPGHAAPAALRPCENETTVNKCGFSVFEDGSLHAALTRAGCDTLILAGLHLHACVRAAATDAYRHGYRVLIADDAVASDDPLHAAVTRRYLEERAVVFLPVATILRHLPIAATSGRLSDWTRQVHAHHSPSDRRRVLFDWRDAPLDEIERAASSAREAWERWQAVPTTQRRATLRSVAGMIKREADALTRMLVEHVGKPLCHAKEEVSLALAFLLATAEQADAGDTQSVSAQSGYRHAPSGVVAVITPWNNPLAVPIGKLAPALLYGNTVVWKPAPAGNAVANYVARMFLGAGCPTGVIQIVQGGAATARCLASSSHVDAVTLTGSIDAGYAIQEIAVHRHIPFQAELGGNNGAIVCADANLEHAAAMIADAAFGFAGQRCTASRRAIVLEPCFDRFLSQLSGATAAIPWGDPREITTRIGPVISAAKRDELEALTRHTRRTGCEIEMPHLAHHEGPADHGLYFPPTIIRCDDAAHPVIQEESFGPILVIQHAKTFDHALELLDAVEQGLVASLFTERASFRERFFTKARAGILKINQATAGADPAAPFGGWKASGVGPPEHGRFDRAFFTRPQAIYEAPALASYDPSP